MKTLLIKQENGFMIMTESAWKSHLHMVNFNFRQEETEEEAILLGTEYESSFEIEEINDSQIKDYQKKFKIEVNENKKINSFFGTLIHF